MVWQDLDHSFWGALYIRISCVSSRIFLHHIFSFGSWALEKEELLWVTTLTKHLSHVSFLFSPLALIGAIRDNSLKKVWDYILTVYGPKGGGKRTLGTGLWLCMDGFVVYSGKGEPSQLCSISKSRIWIYSFSLRHELDVVADRVVMG